MNCTTNPRACCFTTVQKQHLVFKPPWLKDFGLKQQIELLFSIHYQVQVFSFLSLGAVTVYMFTRTSNFLFFSFFCNSFLCWAAGTIRLLKTLKTSNFQHVIKVRNAFNYAVPVVQKHAGGGPTSQAPVTTPHSTLHVFSHDGNSTSHSLSSSHDPSLTKHEPQMQGGKRTNTHTHTHTHTHTYIDTHTLSSVSHEQWHLKLAANSKHQVTSVLFWDQWNQPDDPWLLTFHCTRAHTHTHTHTHKYPTR